MFEAFGLSPLNRLLRSNPWELEQLRLHAGKSAVLKSPPFELGFSIADSGELSAAPAATPPDVTIVTTPGLVLRVLSGDESASGDVQIAGDVQFAGALDYVRRNLRWDYEESLSRLFGDIAAHRMAAGVRGLERWARVATVNLARTVAEYAMHENPQVASAQALEQYNADVDRTRDDVERLEKRIELLTERLASGR